MKFPYAGREFITNSNYNNYNLKSPCISFDGFNLQISSVSSEQQTRFTNSEKTHESDNKSNGGQI